MKAKVKWWNDSKGYGFLTNGEKDIYIHYTALVGEGFKSLSHMVDKEVEVEILEHEKGPQAIRCTGWEHKFNGHL